MTELIIDSFAGGGQTQHGTDLHSGAESAAETSKKQRRIDMSDTKRYPTRMHEVLGVEVDEEATYKSTTKELKDFRFFVDEYGSPRYPSRLLLDGYDMANIINHPERILRKPRLTEEQLYALEALYRVFGCKWIVYDAVSDWVLASAGKPSKTEREGEWTFLGPSIDLFLSDVLCKMASEAAPLDIVKTLKAAGVEVE